MSLKDFKMSSLKEKIENQPEKEVKKVVTSKIKKTNDKEKKKNK